MKKKMLLFMATLCLVLFTACSNGSTTMDNGKDTNGMQGEPGMTENGGEKIMDDAGDAVNDVVDGAGKAVRDATNGVENAVDSMTGDR